MTAFYTGRAFFMTFWGPEKLPSPDDPEAPESALDRRRGPTATNPQRQPDAHGARMVTNRADTSDMSRPRS